MMKRGLANRDPVKSFLTSNPDDRNTFNLMTTCSSLRDPTGTSVSTRETVARTLSRQWSMQSRDPAVFDVFFQHFAGEFRDCPNECPVTACQSMGWVRQIKELATVARAALGVLPATGEFNEDDIRRFALRDSQAVG